MSKFGKIAAIAVAAVVGLGGMVVGKWYMTTTSATIDPQRGIYGMADLEIWIDINARMPDFARVWACKTLMEREAAAMGGQSVRPPYGCSPDFKEQVAAAAGMTMVDQIVNANVQSVLAQAPNATEEQKQTLTACIKEGVPKAVPADKIEATNNADTDAMGVVVLAASEVMRGCMADAGL